MGILDDLLAHAGLYLGVTHDTDGHDTSGDAAARIEVSALPNGSGVLLAYETFNPAIDVIRGHHERSMLVRTHAGPTMLVVAHSHSGSAAVLRETDPGVFELGDEGSPFPMKIVMSMPEPGVLVHSWWYGRPGGEAEEKDRTEVRLQRP
jgi:hypothetical protein